MQLYDKIGVGYNTTRKADPYLANRFYELLGIVPGGIYLDVGCGTGNYLSALVGKGLNFHGVDASELMLKEAGLKNPDVKLYHNKIEDLSLESEYFHGATAILTMHHWGNLDKGLEQVYRVLRPGSKMVAFSFTPEQVKGYWLTHYFPQMIERAAAVVPSIEELETLLLETGFKTVEFESYFVLPDLEDHFMYSCKHAPERCLDPEMRKNTSGFTALADQEEIEEGLLQLAEDIRTGKIDEVIKDFSNELGDYLFVIAEK
ncbi:MAG: methyltransferase domain-containing protein [Bacteroidetes bacterium]|nr:methyltransferase domain-containing protein [Bacteroidota bacterium]